MKTTARISLFSLAFAGVSHAALFVDFNSTNQDGGPHPEGGYESYDAGHEVATDFVTMNYNTTFALTGAATVGVTPAWPNTIDNRVQQMIDRGAGNDANWTGTALDLVTDYIGTDTRTGSGGNGDWNGTTGTPTYMTLTLGGLPAGGYTWTSFHQDTENVHGHFAVWLDTGANFSALADGVMTDSSPGGNPDSMNLVTDFAGMAAAGSIYQTTFAANGIDDVVLRFAPYANLAVHTQIWGMNGFQLEQVPEPSTSLLGLLGGLLFLRRRR
ncbi:hypothetical protein BH23VER1_BH23VER1_12420 [soil metagenome]